MTIYFCVIQVVQFITSNR